MPARDLVEAWALLLVLSAATVLIAAVGGAERGAVWGAVGVLILSGLKARVILARYLSLSGSRFWMRAFGLVIAIFLAIAFGLYCLAVGA